MHDVEKRSKQSNSYQKHSNSASSQSPGQDCLILLHEFVAKVLWLWLDRDQDKPHCLKHGNSIICLYFNQALVWKPSPILCIRQKSIFLSLFTALILSINLIQYNSIAVAYLDPVEPKPFYLPDLAIYNIFLISYYPEFVHIF